MTAMYGLIQQSLIDNDESIIRKCQILSLYAFSMTCPLRASEILVMSVDDFNEKIPTSSRSGTAATSRK